MYIYIKALFEIRLSVADIDGSILFSTSLYECNSL